MQKVQMQDYNRRQEMGRHLWSPQAGKSPPLAPLGAHADEPYSQSDTLRGRGEREECAPQPLTLAAPFLVPECAKLRGTLP